MRFLTCLCAVFMLVACSAPAQPVLPSATPVPSVVASPVLTLTPTVPSLAVSPSPVLTSERPTSIPETLPTPTEVLSEWEQVQKQVGALRNRLDSTSDGYTGLTQALQEAGPTEAWCGGLAAAIGDFNYVNDSASAQALTDLQAEQGCP